MGGKWYHKNRGFADTFCTRANTHKDTPTPTHSHSRTPPFESTNAGWLLRRLGRPAVAQELVPDHQRHARLGEGLTRGVAHVRALFAKSPGCTP